jgi:1,4-alpha-glucan branching enzyme
MVTVKSKFVEFEFFRPHAHEVHIVGDFNGWRNDQLPMHQTADGHWQARVRLPEGVFRFRYFADGQWYTDYAAFGVEPGPYGPVGIVYVPSGSRQRGEETSCLPEEQLVN